MNIISLSKGLQATVYSAKNSGVCAAFLSNVHSKQDATVRFNGVSYNLPAWSVSILPVCKKVVYNTARISIQTSLMGMEQVSMESLHPVGTSSGDRGKISVNWSWHKEDVAIWGENEFSAHGLLEQLSTVLDKSDYLWYTTRYSEPVINFFI